MGPRLGRLIVALTLIAPPALAVNGEKKAPANAAPPALSLGRMSRAPQGKPQKPASSVPLITPLARSAVPEAAKPAAAASKGILPGLSQTVKAIAAEQSAAPGSERPAGAAVSGTAFDASQWSGPDFEPPMSGRLPPQEPPSGNGGGGGGGDDENGRPDAERPSLSFGQAAKSSLLAIDPAKAIYGAMKIVRETVKKPGERKNGSEKYWDAYKRGVAIDVTVKDENIFGRPTKITYAATKRIAQLSRDDFKGIVPAFQLQLPIKQLRQSLVERLDESRAYWHRSEPALSLDTRVRVVKFQSYIALFKEAHGKDAVPKPEPVVARSPVVLKPMGKLETLARFLPRAIFLDVDMLEGALSRELLNDIAELQRTGVYLVAFSRKPYNAPGGMYDTLVKNMGPAQLTAQMPRKFLAVTDDGAVISELQKNGNTVPVDVAAFSAAELDVVRDAAQKALEKTGVARGDAREVRQPAIFVAGERFNPFRKAADKKEKAEPRDPHVRYELAFPKNVDEKTLGAWIASFKRRLKEQGLAVKTRLIVREDGTKSFVMQKTDLPQALDRLYGALGDAYGVYINSNDILVFSDDKKLKKINPRLNIGQAAGLKGGALVENVVGLMLGKAREGGKKGSASRMAQFSGYRERYMSQFLVAQDSAEQNINFFSGHMVHSSQDWLVHQLQNGKRPTPAEYEGQLRGRWNRGIREVKPVGLPKGQRMERLLNASVRRGLRMYEQVLDIHDRGEILIGTEIPNFVVFEDYKRGEDGKLKDRYIVHTIFDFIALRPDPKNPGHATVVIYDFKTGPAKSKQKLEKDDQVRTYSLFAYERWVGQRFPVPYLSGENSYVIDAAVVEFIYNLVQPADIDNYMRENQRKRVIRVFNAIQRTEAKLLGVTPGGKPSEAAKSKKAKSPKTKKSQKKKS